jgi:ActR/RegA family two-component response regulator
MARGNDCEVVAKIVEEHGGRRVLVITGWGMLGSSH